MASTDGLPGPGVSIAVHNEPSRAPTFAQGLTIDSSQRPIRKKTDGETEREKPLVVVAVAVAGSGGAAAARTANSKCNDESRFKTK